MCFSAGASFTAGVLLSGVGEETIRKIHKPSQIAFACIPVFFAFQQFAEGILWVTVRHPEYVLLRTVTTYIFIIMAQVIWPILIPLSVLLMEWQKNRKRILHMLLWMGLAVGLYFLFRLLYFDMRADISYRHLIYQSSVYDPYGHVALAFYLAATLIPLFISSLKRSYVLGLIMLASFVVSAVYYQWCLTSVWCFFAAVMSFMIYYIVRDAHKKYHFDRLLKKVERKVEHMVEERSLRN